MEMVSVSMLFLPAHLLRHLSIPRPSTPPGSVSFFPHVLESISSSIPSSNPNEQLGALGLHPLGRRVRSCASVSLCMLLSSPIRHCRRCVLLLRCVGFE